MQRLYNLFKKIIPYAERVAQGLENRYSGNLVGEQMPPSFDERVREGMKRAIEEGRLEMSVGKHISSVRKQMPPSFDERVREGMKRAIEEEREKRLRD